MLGGKTKGRKRKEEKERARTKDRGGRETNDRAVCSTLAFLSPGPLTQPQLPVAVSAIDKRDFHETEIRK